MVYKKFEDEQGPYIDIQGKRWTIMEAHEAYTPEGLNVGWDSFESLEQAIQAYGLIYQPIEEEK